MNWLREVATKFRLGGQPIVTMPSQFWWRHCYWTSQPKYWGGANAPPAPPVATSLIQMISFARIGQVWGGFGCIFISFILPVIPKIEMNTIFNVESLSKYTFLNLTKQEMLIDKLHCTLEQILDWIQLVCTWDPKAPGEHPHRELWNEPPLYVSRLAPRSL